MKITDDKARMTPEDIATLKAMFEEREGAVEVIRKIFYPELTADAPIHLNRDMMTGLNFTGMTPDQMVIAVEAHNKLINHVEGCLAVVKTLIGKKHETPDQVLARLRQDSAK